MSSSGKLKDELVNLVKHYDEHIISKLFWCHEAAKSFYYNELVDSMKSMVKTNNLFSTARIGNITLSNELMWKLAQNSPIGSDLMDVIVNLLEIRNASICNGYNDKHRMEKNFRT